LRTPPGTDKRAKVDGGFAALEVTEIVGKRIPIKGNTIFYGLLLQLFPQTVIYRGDGVAFAGDFRRDALGNLTGGAIVREDVEFRLTLNVDEAWRRKQTYRIQPFSGGNLAEIPDRGEAIADNADIRDIPRGTGAVDNTGTTYNEIVVRLFSVAEAGKEEEGSGG